MDPYSSASRSDCRTILSDKLSNEEDDYLSKLLDFEDNVSTEVRHPSEDANRMMLNDGLKINHDQVTSEETFEKKTTNGHSHMSDESFDENDEDIHHNIIKNGFSWAPKLKELMEFKKEAYNLHEQWEQTEKEKKRLQVQVDLLQAENHQFRHLKNQQEEKIQKLNELQKDLTNKSKAQLKLQNEIESCNLKISNKNDDIKKMKKDHKSLLNLITQFARKLENADLLTVKEKTKLKKYCEDNHISVDAFNFEGEEEETDHASLLSKSEMCTVAKQNENKTISSYNFSPTHSKESESENFIAKNESLQFNHGSTYPPKSKLSSGANYFMKSYKDVIEDPHMQNDFSETELKKFRSQHVGVNSPISPLPPTPPLSISKLKHNPLRKDSMGANPTMTLPVYKSPSQIPMLSKNQGLLNVGNSSPANSSKKLKFCHQESEGFDVPIEDTVKSNTGNSNNYVENTSSDSISSLIPYRLGSKRLNDGTLKLNFRAMEPICFTVDPKHWEINCFLGRDKVETSDTFLTVQPQVNNASVQTNESFTNNLVSFETSEPMISKVSKVEPVSPPELISPVLKNFEQNGFVSAKKPNMNYNLSVNTNLFDFFSKETFQKELLLDDPRISVNDSKAQDAFTNQHRDVYHQHIEHHIDNNQPIVSNYYESPLPNKKNELFSREFLSPSHNISSYVSEMKSEKSDKLLNVSKVCSFSVSKMHRQTECNSTDSEFELTDKSELTKLNLEKCEPVKKRRQSSLTASVESSHIVPTRNKGRTLLSRAFGSYKNSKKANTGIEKKKLENNKDGNYTSTTVHSDDDKFLSESHNKIEEQIKINSSIDSFDSNNCILPKNIAGVNENIDEPMQEIENVYENDNSRKRVSRFKAKSTAKVKQNKDSDVGKSPKNKMKRMTALKNKAAKWTALTVNDVQEKEHIAEEPFNSDLCISNTVDESLERHDAGKFFSDLSTNNNTQHEEEISDIFEQKPKKMDNISFDSDGNPVEPCTKMENNDISLLVNDILTNILSTECATYDEDEENMKLVAKESNIIMPDSASSILKNNHPGELFCAVDNNQIDSEPVVATNQYKISDFPNNQVPQQKLDIETQNLELSKLKSPLKANKLPSNRVYVSPIQESSDPHNKTDSMPSPFQKSPKISIKLNYPKSSPLKIRSPKDSPLKVKSPSELPAKARSSDLDSFSNINISEVNTNFPEVSLPPLPLDPFGLSSNKTGVDENSDKSPISPTSKKSAKLPVSKRKKKSKITSISGNINDAKNNLTNHEEITNDSLLDFLLKDEAEDCSRKTVSYAENKKMISSNTKTTIDNSMDKAALKESLASLNANSVNIATSVAQSFEAISNVYSNVDAIINGVAADDITEKGESKASSQVDSDSLVPSATNSLQAVSNVYSNVDTVIDSVAIGDAEIEVETQDPPFRNFKKQGTIVESLHQVDRKRVKGGLKSIDLSIAKESALSDDDTKHVNGDVSGADSDNESPLVIAEDFEEVLQSVHNIKVENSEEEVVDKISLNESAINKQNNGFKTPKKIGNKIDLAHIEAAFQAIDRIRFTETHFRLHVHNLVTVLNNPSALESTPKLAFHLVKYLHTTRKNPMLSFSISKKPDILFPTSEQCIVKALIAVNAKNKPHLSGLITYIVETLYQLVLGKVQYHIYGLSSLCRVMTAICKELNDPSKPRSLCCDLLKYNHKFAPFLIASMVGVYREAFQILPDSTEEENIFLSALSYGVQQKPKTLTETQWKHCSNVFSEYLTGEFLTNVSETMPYLISAIEEKCLSAPCENEYLLVGPLVIYARVKGWNWAEEHLLEGYVLPNLQAYSEEVDGERAFSFFTDLCADICYGCPDEELSRSCLMKYWTRFDEKEFIQIHAGASLLKLILLRKELFPDEMQEWIPYYHEDPRVIESSNIYFRLRLMEDQELDLQNNVIF